MIYEKPWQTRWDTTFYWEGYTKDKSGKGNSTVMFPENEPIHYRYELVVPPEAANVPPAPVIVSPKQDARYYAAGEAVRLIAEAADKQDGKLGGDSLSWEVWPNAGKVRPLLASGKGSSFTFSIPLDAPHDDDFNQYFVKVTAKDSQGLTGLAYATLGVAPPYPPSPVLAASFDSAAPLKSSARVPGGKVTGTLSTNGKLYAWVITRSGVPPEVKLASSGDEGKSWQLSEWSFPGNGTDFYPLTFVQGPADRLVYLFGATWPKGTAPCFACRSAYLARVPADQIGDRAAYEYFQWRSDANARWTKNATQFYQMLSAPEGIGVPAVVYHAQSKRFVAAVVAGKQLWLLDAAQPWGPWTTAGLRENWNGGEGPLRCEWTGDSALACGTERVGVLAKLSVR